jgi:hypothetical protein
MVLIMRSKGIYEKNANTTLELSKLRNQVKKNETHCFYCLRFRGIGLLEGF